MVYFSLFEDIELLLASLYCDVQCRRNQICLMYSCLTTERIYIAYITEDLSLDENIVTTASYNNTTKVNLTWGEFNKDFVSFKYYCLISKSSVCGAGLGMQRFCAFPFRSLFRNEFKKLLLFPTLMRSVVNNYLQVKRSWI